MLLFSLVAHEVAHGWAALWQGDRTAQELGRLSWNPIRHIHPVLTLVLPLLTWYASGFTFVFGGARPVPVVAANFRHYRRGDIIVSLAGVAANLAIAVACTALIAFTGWVARSLPEPALDSVALLQLMLRLGVRLNLVLFAFNLLPVPPLDGSRLLMHLLPRRWAGPYLRMGSVALVVLILLSATGAPILSWWMAPVDAANVAALRAVHHFVIPGPWTS